MLKLEGAICPECKGRLKPSLSLAPARDVGDPVGQAARGHVLEPAELLDVQATLGLARSVRDTLSRLRVHIPLLAETAERALKPTGAFQLDTHGIAEKLRAAVELMEKKDVARKGQPAFADLTPDQRLLFAQTCELLHSMDISSPEGWGSKQFFAEAVRNALNSVLILVILNVAFFMSAFVAFLRCDVR